MSLGHVVWNALALFSNPPAFQDLKNPAFSSQLSKLTQLISDLQSTDIGLPPDKVDQLKNAGKSPVLYMSIVDAEDDEMLTDSHNHFSSEEDEETHTSSSS